MSCSYMSIRSLICSFLGHVDHGKSSILDAIRNTSIVKGEAGGITQSIGASIVPTATIQKICASLLSATKMDVTVPGLLLIDTPGHAAFTNLRKRGGSLADISVLVVDINEGLMPQTKEAIEILRAHKTPFIIAANKVDKLPAWESKEGLLLKNIAGQSQTTQTALETKMYEIVGAMHELGVACERFDRVTDFTKEFAIVPCSAMTGEGISELLFIMLRLAQKYLEKGLHVDLAGPAKGVVVEVKESKGLGTTLDTIIFDGHLKKNDTIVIGGLEEPVVTKVRALLEPNPLADMRDKKSAFKQVPTVAAAIGVRIAAPEIDGVIAGMPFRAVGGGDDVDAIADDLMAQVDDVVIEADGHGVILKADTLGSLEALITLFREHDIAIRKATIGHLSKRDILEAAANKEEDPYATVVLGFNVNVSNDVLSYAKDMGVTVFDSPVIYNLLDSYQEWFATKQRELEADKLGTVMRPCRVELLKGYVFRQSNPAICGIEIQEGRCQLNTVLMKKNADRLTYVKSMNKDKDSVKVAQKGDQVAVSLPDITIGRQVEEGEILYSMMSEDDFRQLKELKKLLTPQEIEILKEIAQIMRQKNPSWGL